MNKRRIVIYCRIGHAEKQEAALYLRIASPVSDSYRKALKETLYSYAKKNGYKNPVIYEDFGCSGLTLTDRPAFQRMQKDIENGRIQTVIVSNISHIGRNMWEVLSWISRVRAKGVNLVIMDSSSEALMDNGILQNIPERKAVDNE